MVSKAWESRKVVIIGAGDVGAILRNERSILTVSTLLEGEYGISVKSQ